MSVELHEQGPLPLSLKRAARALGVDKATLRAMIAAGAVHPIPWGKRVRVLVADIERVKREGFSLRAA